MQSLNSCRGGGARLSLLQCGKIAMQRCGAQMGNLKQLRVTSRAFSSGQVHMPAASKSKHMGWKIAGGLIAVVAASGAAVWITDEGTRRSTHFWRRVMPIWMHYRFVQITSASLPEEEKDAKYAVLHDTYAGAVEDIMLELKGMYLKNAQLLSTRDEFIPPQYMAVCKRVQDQVPTDFTPEEVHATIEASMRKPMSQVFKSFDDTPLGAASIGQAHLATLLDGRQVIVKVMYPGIEERFRSDLKTMQAFCEWAMPQHVSALKEIEKQFLTEFDYLGEAANMKEIHDNVMPVYGHKVHIPQPLLPLCSKEVLVMEYVPGVRLVDGIRAAYREYAERVGKTLEQLEAEQKEGIRNGTISKKSLEEDHRQTQMANLMLWAQDAVANTSSFLLNYTLGWFTAKPWEYHHSKPLVDLGATISLLNEVHAYEIFQNGSFNGDPHPGNVLLCPDGRLGLIDYGQVKRVDMKTRTTYARLICALADNDKERTLAIYDEIGFRTKYNNRDIRYQLARFWNDCDDASVIGDRNVHTFLEWAHEQDPVEDVPQEYVMFARVSVLLRGVANAFGLHLRTAPLWEKAARRLLKEQGIEC